MPPRLPLRSIASPLPRQSFSAIFHSARLASTTPFPPAGSSSGPKTGRNRFRESSPLDPNGGYKPPPLSRPLGVPKPPSSAPKTPEQQKAEAKDEKRAKTIKDDLWNEAKQGYFHDYHAVRKEGGYKLWQAPNVLIREDKALYLPDISGSSLLHETVHTTDLCKGKVSIVGVTSTRIADEHIQSFVRPTLESVEGHPHFNYIQINYQPNLLKSMLLKFSINSIKRSIPEERWGSYMLSSGEWSQIDIRRPLSMSNSLLGYVFLIDENCKIRWAGTGDATEEEAVNLRRATAVLLGRIKGADGKPLGGVSSEGEVERAAENVVKTEVGA
ncbi:hypothetical protein IAT38_004142 [Cryptococcus sp. DSM 104549]